MKYTKIDANKPESDPSARVLVPGDMVCISRCFDQLRPQTRAPKKTKIHARGKLTLRPIGVDVDQMYLLEGAKYLADKSIATIIGIFTGRDASKEHLLPKDMTSTWIYVIGNGFKGWLRAVEAKKINK